MGDKSTSTDDTSTTPGTGDEPLGAGGMKALEAERKARRDAEHRASQAQARVRELELANERRDVAAAKGLTAEQAKYLAGDSREDLEQAADGLLAAFGATRDTGARSGRSRPKEALHGGASTAADDDRPDAGRIAEQVLNRGL